MQDAETVCTAEEAEAELPVIKKQVMDLIGDMLRKKKIDIDHAFSDKDSMVYLATRLHNKADKYEESAKATLDALKTELVCINAAPRKLTRNHVCTYRSS